MSPLLNFYGGVMGIPARRNATQRHGGRNPPTGHTHTHTHLGDSFPVSFIGGVWVSFPPVGLVEEPGPT